MAVNVGSVGESSDPNFQEMIHTGLTSSLRCLELPYIAHGRIPI